MKNKVKEFTFFVVSFFLFSPIIMANFEKVNPESLGYSSKELNTLIPLVEPLVDQGKLPNYLISIYKDNKLMFQSLRGYRDVDSKTEITEDTIFWQASMSKPIVSVAVLKLIEERKLSLEDKLDDFFPEFTDVMVAPGGSYNRPLEIINRSITIKDLLTHTAGFTYGASIIGSGDVATAYDEVNPINNYQKTGEQNMSSLSELPLVAQPGTSFNYSVSIDVLGAVIEKVTGKGLAQYVNEEIFTPLDMDHSGWFFSGDLSEKVATVYTQITRTVQVPGEKLSFKKMEQFGDLTCRGMPPQFPSAGGGLCTSADDFAKFLFMLLNKGKHNGKQIIKPETAEMMFENHLPEHLGKDGLVSSFGDFAGNQYFSLGFGLALEQDSAEIDYIWWGGAANTLFWADPKSNVVGLFLTQHFPVAYNIMDTLEETVDRAKL